jgi:hypothetical protein
MANMSYCRFENTSNDLKDCVLTMEEEMEDLSDLNEYELRAFKHMKTLCERFLESYERLTGEDES